MKRLTVLLLVLAPFTLLSKPDRPNILWFTSEDNSLYWIGCYGSPNAKTPNIDQLAEEGFRYSYCFNNAAVCAPTRSTWITGMYAISMGTQPMRSRYDIPNDQIAYYPDLLRKLGYHSSNPGKTDYNIGSREDKDCWDYAEREEKYGWRLRKPGQPFFSVVNNGMSHEGAAHGEKMEGALAWTEVREHDVDPDQMKLHAYHPDLPVIRDSYARYANRIGVMDKQFGECIEALKEDGLYEDTIIIYNSDHGGVMPGSKRFLNSSGIHCPLIIRIPEKWKHLWPASSPGMTVDRLVSFVDMPKTWLSLVGAEIPDNFQGTIFLGDEVEPEPEYHLGFRERADSRYDMVRMIRDKRYAYYKNYMPYAPAGQYLEYMWRNPLAPVWEEYHRQGKTDAVTGRFFEPRVSEEFYDTLKDFDNVHDLIDAPEHRARITTLKKELRIKQLELFDSGLLPESLRINRAKENNLTIYEMVRNPDLYPLAEYLDAADRALERNPENLSLLIKDMNHPDSGMRYWAVVGLHLLESAAEPATSVLKQALQDEEVEVAMMAAWTLVKLGHREPGLARLRSMIGQYPRDLSEKLNNVIDWMDEDGKPLVETYLEYFNKEGKVTDRGRVIQKLADEFGLVAEF